MHHIPALVADGNTHRRSFWQQFSRHRGAGRILHKAFSADTSEWLASGITWAGPDRLLLTNRRLVLFEPAAPALAIRHAE